MRLEPLLTLEIRDNIRRAVSELNDIESILESMGDFTRPSGYYMDVAHAQDTIFERTSDATELISDSLRWIKYMQECINNSHDMTLEDLEKLHQP